MSDFSDDDSEPILTSLEIKFNKAADHVQKVHSTLSSGILLEIYGLYKQATVGECNIPKPGIFNTQGRAKWNAWNTLGKMEKSRAMEIYIEKVVTTGWSLNYAPNDKNQQWVCHSVPVIEDLVVIPEDSKTAVDLIKEGNLEKLIDILDSSEINKLDDNGMGLIHYSADRGSAEILEYLLNNGADINLLDQDGQTATHYASSCGHAECVLILLKFNPNLAIEDSDGQTCVEVAFDEKIKNILLESIK